MDSNTSTTNPLYAIQIVTQNIPYFLYQITFQKNTAKSAGVFLQCITVNKNNY